MKNKIIVTIFISVVCLQVSFAADSSPSTPASIPAWLMQAKTDVKADKYEQAIQVLQSANQIDSADWNNLMGYSSRKKDSPDLAASERYYLAALKIDPSHKGALEYYGELLLLKNDLDGAEQVLKKLDKACFFSCEEFRDLKQSIANYKSKRTIK